MPALEKVRTAARRPREKPERSAREGKGERSARRGLRQMSKKELRSVERERPDARPLEGMTKKDKPTNAKEGGRASLGERGGTSAKGERGAFIFLGIIHTEWEPVLQLHRGATKGGGDPIFLIRMVLVFVKQTKSAVVQQ